MQNDKNGFVIWLLEINLFVVSPTPNLLTHRIANFIFKFAIAAFLHLRSVSAPVEVHLGGLGDVLIEGTLLVEPLKLLGLRISR